MASVRSSASGAQRAVLLVDVSGSITQERDPWTAATALTEEVLRAAPNSLRLALFTFSQGIEMELDFSESRETLLDYFEKLEAKRWDRGKLQLKTAAIDAVLKVLAAIKTTQPGDSVLLITDGDDNASAHDEEQLVQVLLTCGVRLFAMVLDTRRSQYPAPKGTSEWIFRTADATGGEAVRCLPGQRPHDQLRNVLRRITDSYRLELSVCDPIVKPAPLRIAVVRSANGSSTPLRVRVAYPTVITPAAPTASPR